MELKERHVGILLFVVGTLMLGSQVITLTINRTPIDPAPKNFNYTSTYHYIQLDNFSIVAAGIALTSSGGTILLRELWGWGRARLA